MIWSQVVSKVLQQYLNQKQKIVVAKEKIKGMTLHAGINLAGGLFFGILTMAAIITIFSDLGSQWATQSGTHFSGPIRAALLMFGFGLVVLGVCILVSSQIAKRQTRHLSIVHDRYLHSSHPQDFNPFLLFGEEFFGQLLRKLKQSPSTERRRHPSFRH